MRRHRRGPLTLVLCGDDARFDLLRPLAEQVGVPVVALGAPITGAGVVVVGGPGDKTTAARTAAERHPGLPRLLTPPASTDPAAARALADAGPVGLAAWAAWSPSIAAAGTEIGELGPLAHLGLRVRQPAGAGDPVAEALLVALWATAADPPVEVAAEPGGPLRLHTASGARVEVDAATGPLPEWSMQAASASSVVRVELAPTPGLERDGAPRPLPHPDDEPALAAARHLGLVGLLTDAHRGDLAQPSRWPPGAHLGWAVRLAAVLAAAGRSAAADGGAIPLSSLDG